MASVFTLQEFYKSYFDNGSSKEHLILPKEGHFNVFRRGQFCKHLTAIHRSDFFKISLVVGKGVFHLEDRKIEVNSPSLIFYNPSVPHLWESISEKQEGYFCLFNRQFVKPYLKESYFRNSPLFNSRREFVYTLSKEQTDGLLFIFDRMMRELESSYINKYDLIHHYIQLIIHEANKTQPAYQSSDKYVSASSRITSMFIEILERQFPVDSTEHSLLLKTPHEFADKLSVHVNHLNRAVKEVMGSSTSEIIAARISAEAESLLVHTDNTVAEIAYSLGFEYPSNFNIFFKKQTSRTPKEVRDSHHKKQSIAV